ELPHQAGSADAVFLSAHAAESLCSVRPHHTHPTNSRGHDDSTSARNSCARSKSGAGRHDHHTGTSGPNELHATISGNAPRRIWRNGPAPGRDWSLRGDVVCRLLLDEKTGIAHGAWRGCVGFVATGDVARPPFDR